VKINIPSTETSKSLCPSSCSLHPPESLVDVSLRLWLIEIDADVAKAIFVPAA